MLVDTLLLWLNVYLFDAGRYLFGAGLVSLVLFVFFRQFSKRYKIQTKQASRADIKREITLSAQTIAVYASVALVTIQMKSAGILTVYSDWSEYPLWYGAISLPLILVLHDAYFYWVHRAIHHKTLFRKFHLAHHRSHTPTPWAAYAFAPGEAFMMTLIVPIVTFFLPMHHLVIFAFLTIMIVRNAMGHSGVEFHPRWWVDSKADFLTSVVHHDLHHQRARGNYGLYFTWWDRWMGTEFADYKERFREAAAPRNIEPAETAAEGSVA